MRGRSPTLPKAQLSPLDAVLFPLQDSRASLTSPHSHVRLLHIHILDSCHHTTTESISHGLDAVNSSLNHPPHQPNHRLQRPRMGRLLRPDPEQSSYIPDPTGYDSPLTYPSIYRWTEGRRYGWMNGHIFQDREMLIVTGMQWQISYYVEEVKDQSCVDRRDVRHSVNQRGASPA